MHKERVIIIDYAKAICIIFVIIIHANAYIPLEMDKNVFFILFVDGAVPFFMVLSGYTFSMSCGKKKNFKEMYSIRSIYPKVIRFIVPAVVAVILYKVLASIMRQPFHFVFGFLWGLYGPGSYYCDLMLELVFLFPMLYLLIRRFRWCGVFIAGSVNLLFEAGVTHYAVDSKIYRICILRYLLFIAFGCMIYFMRKSNKKVSWIILLLSMVIGTAYLFSYNYFGYELKIFTYAPGDSMPIAFWSWAVIYIILETLENLGGGQSFVGKIMTLIGQASYHILYTQMIYFAGLNVLKKTIYAGVSNGIILLSSIIVSVVAGIIFYKMETASTKKLFLKRL